MAIEIITIEEIEDFLIIEDLIIIEEEDLLIDKIKIFFLIFKLKFFFQNQLIFKVLIINLISNYHLFIYN